jgi:hypothetical protein
MVAVPGVLQLQPQRLLLLLLLHAVSMPVGCLVLPTLLLTLLTLVQLLRGRQGLVAGATAAAAAAAYL